MKAKHGTTAASTDKRAHNNEMQAARRRARRPTDPAWRAARCRESVAKRLVVKKEVAQYEEYSDVVSESEQDFPDPESAL
jgi:hypothetical protein